MNKKLLLFTLTVIELFFDNSFLHAETVLEESNRKRIERLEIRLAELERKSNNQKSYTGQNKFKLTVQPDLNKNRNWRSLELGMNKIQVENLLGIADNISKGIITETWTYELKNYQIGMVHFSGKGLVTGWNEP